MATVPLWFDEDFYLNQKLASLKAEDAATYGDWTVDDLKMPLMKQA